MLKLLIGFIAVIGCTSEATPCKCPKQPSLDKMIDAHQAIFVGKVSSGRFLGNAPVGRGPYGREFEFELSEVLKGTIKTKYIKVSTGVGLGDCGEDFIVGRDYLVYAKAESDGTLSTGICHYSKNCPGHGTVEAAEIWTLLHPEKWKPHATPAHQEVSQSDKQKARELYLAAIITYDEGNEEQAKKFFEQAQMLDPHIEPTGGLERIKKAEPKKSHVGGRP